MEQNQTAAIDSGSSTDGRKPIVLLRLAIAAALIAPTVFFALAASLAYQEAYEDAQLRLDHAARSVSAHSEKVFDAASLLLDHMNVLLGDRTSTEWRREEAVLHRTFSGLVRDIDEVRGVWYWDEQGSPVAGSRMYPAPSQVTAGDRDYFTVQKLRSSADFYISQVIETRATHATVFTVSRRRELDGRFSGVLSAALTPEYFNAHFRELERVWPGLRLALVRQDGQFLARYPAASIGASLSASGTLRQKISAGESGGTFRTVSGFDGKERLVTFNKLDQYPIYIAVGQSTEAILDSWYEDLLILALFTFPLALSVAGGCWVAMRGVQREQQALLDRQLESDARRRAELALGEARRLEVLGRLAAGVAHDFNNLLAVVSNAVHVQRLQFPQVAESRYLTMIEKAVATGTKLTRQLLSLSRHQTLTPEPVLLQATLNGLAQVVQTAVGSRVRVRMQVAEDTPRIMVDVGELELALLNLALNARDAMPDGGELMIDAGPATRPQIGEHPEVILRVRDTGMGIPADLLEKVTDPFFTTKELGKGTGLGLSQVRGFAEQAGGRVQIRSEVGAYTEVRITLPGLVDDCPAKQPAHPRTAGNLSCTVLVIEDNPDLAISTGQVLVQAGCEVVHASSADEGKSFLQSDAGHRVDVVVSDVITPGNMSGLELAVWLKTSGSGLPIVLVSGYTNELERAREAGIHILQKPVNPGALLLWISEAHASAIAPSRQPPSARRTAPDCPPTPPPSLASP